MREALVLIGHGLAPGHQLGGAGAFHDVLFVLAGQQNTRLLEGFAHGGHDAAARFRHVGVVKLLLPVFGAGAHPRGGFVVTGERGTAGEGHHAQRRSARAVGQDGLQTVVAVAHEDDGGRLAHRAAGGSLVTFFSPAFRGGPHELGDHVEALNGLGAGCGRGVAAREHAGTFGLSGYLRGAESALLHGQGQRLHVVGDAGSLSLAAFLRGALRLGRADSRQRQCAGVQLIRHTQR